MWRSPWPIRRSSTSTFSQASANGTLYIGVTRDIAKRLADHRAGKGSKFVTEYAVLRLVYVEAYERADEAIAREKQLKKWNRAWKLELIEKANPQWRDLSEDITA